MANPTTRIARKPKDPLESALSDLLEATQALREQLAEEAPASDLDAAYVRRLEAFEALRRVSDGQPLRATRAKQLLAQIRELDRELLAGAEQVASGLRADRSSIARARHAISAHAAKERTEPRLLVVRA